jgi:hypothetical protein
MSAEAVALRLPKVAIRYFDFGEARSNMVGDGCCRAEQRGIPQPMASWFTACVQGFVPTALAIGGAKNPRVRVGEVTTDGKRGGIETVTLTFEFSWNAHRRRSMEPTSSNS